MDAITKAISQTLQGWSTVLEPPVAPVRGIGFWSWFCNIESIYNAVRVYYLTIIIVCLLLYVALNEWNKRREGRPSFAVQNTIHTGNISNDITGRNCQNDAYKDSSQSHVNHSSRNRSYPPNQTSITSNANQLATMTYINNTVTQPNRYRTSENIHVWIKKFEHHAEITRAHDWFTLLLTFVDEECGRHLIKNNEENLTPNLQYASAKTLMINMYERPETSEFEAQQLFLTRTQQEKENLFVYAELRSLVKEAYPTLDTQSHDQLVKNDSSRE